MCSCWTHARCLLNWKLLAALGLLLAAGCTATSETEPGLIRTFIGDFARQALAVFLL
jgi:hypothetical protein